MRELPSGDRMVCRSGEDLTARRDRSCGRRRLHRWLDLAEILAGWLVLRLLFRCAVQASVRLSDVPGGYVLTTTQMTSHAAFDSRVLRLLFQEISTGGLLNEDYLAAGLVNPCASSQ